jgi:hypothetical protein
VGLNAIKTSLQEKYRGETNVKMKMKTGMMKPQTKKLRECQHHLEAERGNEEFFQKKDRILRNWLTQLWKFASPNSVGQVSKFVTQEKKINGIVLSPKQLRGKFPTSLGDLRLFSQSFQLIE